MLYYKEDADKLRCDICGADWYKERKDIKKSLIVKKILRYFPFAPRFKLIHVKHKIQYIRWYKNKEVIEGQITHFARGMNKNDLTENYHRL